MNVTLLSHTNNWKRIIWTAARTCYSGDCPCVIWDGSRPALLTWDEDGAMKIIPSKWNEDDFNKLLSHLYKSGHWSVFEHVHFVFAVCHTSRQTTHQQVRHRHFSYSQQSMRYVKLDDPKVNIHEIFESMDLGVDDYYGEPLDISWRDAFMMYNSAIAQGVHQEDARGILPIATQTNIIISGNLRSLMDMASERRCVLAQDEIRRMVGYMKNALSNIDGRLGRMMAIKCQRLGYCPEERNVDNKVCSIRPHVDTLGLNILKVIP